MWFRFLVYFYLRYKKAYVQKYTSQGIKDRFWTIACLIGNIHI